MTMQGTDVLSRWLQFEAHAAEARASQARKLLAEYESARRDEPPETTQLRYFDPVTTAILKAVDGGAFESKLLELVDGDRRALGGRKSAITRAVRLAWPEIEEVWAYEWDETANDWITYLDHRVLDAARLIWDKARLGEG